MHVQRHWRQQIIGIEDQRHVASATTPLAPDEGAIQQCAPLLVG
jgi:hypothetical protein